MAPSPGTRLSGATGRHHPTIALIRRRCRTSVDPHDGRSQRLYAEVAGPESLVASRAVFKRRLHAVAQGRGGHFLDLPKIFRHTGRQRGQGRVGRK